MKQKLKKPRRILTEREKNIRRLQRELKDEEKLLSSQMSIVGFHNICVYTDDFDGSQARDEVEEARSKIQIYELRAAEIRKQLNEI